MNAYIIAIFMVFLSSALGAQDRFATIESRLEVMAIDQPGLDETVEMSVDGITLHQFIRGLGINHDLNLSVDAGLDDAVTNTFSDALVSDILVFLCKEYDLDIDFVGSIISVKRFARPPVVQEPVAERIPEVDYNPSNDFLSLDLKRDSLDKVAKEITKRTLKNVVLAPEVRAELVSVFIQNRPFDSALEKMAFANGLKVTKDEGGFYLVEKADKEKKEVTADRAENARPRLRNGDRRQNDRVSTVSGIQMNVNENGRLDLSVMDTDIGDVIRAVSQEMYTNFFLYSQPEGRTDLYVENATYEDFLTHLLSGTQYTYKVEEGVFLIGESSAEMLRTTTIVRLENRTVEKVVEIIPEDLKAGMTVAEFVDLNAIIVTGSYNRIELLEDFLRTIDQPVPTVLIEVMIVDYNKTRTVSGGINAGLGNGPQTTGGLISGSNGTQMNLTSMTINSLINSFNGFGLLNLGNVTPQFYMNIQALETDGVLRTRSTPKLSTLNGHEASLSIGETEYYLEETNRFIGTQNPALETQQTYQSVNADLSITIKPTVAGNDEVTLDITVAQSDFTTKIAETAPPNSVTRDFESKVRIKNGDMILLGGLESKTKNKSGSGLPFISRIPVIKWLFGTRSDTKSRTKLNVFIKATVIH